MSTPRDRYLVTVDEVRDRLGDPLVRVVDVRWSLGDPQAGRARYEAGHVPGAVYLSWLDDFSDPDDPVEGQLAPPGRFAEVMSSHGIGDQHEVVAYDDGEILMAPRLLWALRQYGHDRVRVLDGGWRAWVAAAGPIEPGRPAPRRASFTVGSTGRLRLTKDEVLDAVRSSSAHIVDCRMDETYWAAGSHILGATRMPAPQLFDRSTGRLLPDGELRTLASEAGIGEPGNEEAKPIILYCGGGVSASAAFMALRVVGVDHALVYDGSWTEWGSDETLPREPHAER